MRLILLRQVDDGDGLLLEAATVPPQHGVRRRTSRPRRAALH
jgi:hypothetical protein